MLRRFHASGSALYRRASWNIASAAYRVTVNGLTACPKPRLGVQFAPSESLHAYELGYRYDLKQRFAIDLALFYNSYGQLVGSGAEGQPFINPYPFFIGVPVPFANLGNGQTHGLEIYGKYTPWRRWTLSAGLTELRGNSVAGLEAPAIAQDPRHQFNVQSRLSLTSHLNADANYYYYSAMNGFTTGLSGLQKLDSINRLDVGFSTQPYHGFSLSFWGRNLASAYHPETSGYAFINGEVPRSFVFRVIWESRAPEKNANTLAVR
jgi:iron complex outermembrane receptor protein